MNVATRVMGGTAAPMTLRRLNTISFSGYGVGLICLVALLFFSAFGIVYAKDLNRRLLIQEQVLEKENILAHEHWGKLLLERGILARESRIHHFAEVRLKMVAPDPHQVRVAKLTDLNIING